MNNKARYFEVIERSLNGPVMSEADFDMKSIYQGVKKVVKKYDINIKDDNIINMDKDLSDRVWEASIEFLAECGVYSKDTGRVIKYTEEEIRYYLQEAPAEAIYGEKAETPSWK